MKCKLLGMTCLTGFFNYNHNMFFFMAAYCVGGKGLYRFIKSERETYRIVSKQKFLKNGCINPSSDRKDLF